MLYLFEVRGMGGPVVKTINMTSMADKLGAEFGAEVFEVPVGFKNIAPKMMETDAVLGGEESGGFAIRGHIPERDGILIGLLFADMIVRMGKPLSQILADLERRVGPHAYAATTSTWRATPTTRSASGSSSCWRPTSRQRSRASRSRGCDRTTVSSSTSTTAAGCCSGPAAPSRWSGSTRRRRRTPTSRRA